MTPAKTIYAPKPALLPTAARSMQGSLDRGSRWLHPKEWLRLMAENVVLPRWLVVCVIGAVLPAIFGLLVGLGAFMWSISNTVTRIDERQSVQDYKIRQTEVQGKLNEEHLRQAQIDFATLNGWQKGRAGESKPQSSVNDFNQEPQQ